MTVLDLGFDNPRNVDGGGGGGGGETLHYTLFW